eukprot:m51a1_g1062 hypothetical protein (124) ;mRNA; f:823011-823382
MPGPPLPLPLEEQLAALLSPQQPSSASSNVLANTACTARVQLDSLAEWCFESAAPVEEKARTFVRAVEDCAAMLRCVLPRAQPDELRDALEDHLARRLYGLFFAPPEDAEADRRLESKVTSLN